MKLKQPGETFAQYFDHKPSRAPQAMCDGLDTALLRDDFKVNMSTFGDPGTPDICFGCAATCTVLQAEGWGEGLDLQARVTRLGDPDMTVDRDTWVFEQVIDYARQGRLDLLSGYMGVRCPVELEVDWDVGHVDDYPLERGRILETIAELAALGL